MFCTKCGTQLNEGSAFCSRCGTRVSSVTQQVTGAMEAPQPTEDLSPKSRLAVTLLSCPVLYVGLFGAHRFYMGKIGTAVIMLLLGVAPFICGAGIMAMIFSSNGFDDGDSPPPLFYVLYGLAAVSYFVVFV